MRAGAALLIFLALAGFVGLVRQPAAAQPEIGGLYLALGDSIAAGIGSSLPRERSYPALVHHWLEQESGGTIPFANLAIPGETTESFTSGGQLQALQREADLASQAGLPLIAVTLSLGGNDLLNLSDAGLAEREAGLERFRVSYRAAAEAVRNVVGPDTPLILTTLYDLTGGDAAVPYSDAWWVAQFNEVIQNVAGETSSAVVDLREGFQNEIPELTLYPTDVHPTNRGQLAIARLVWASLGSTGDPPRIEVVSSLTVTRDTPTLRFRVDNPIELVAAHVVIGDTETAATSVGDGEWVALLDLSGIETRSISVRIRVVDMAGEQGETEVTLERSGEG
jgi:lysophospholipase L1-like esterase